MVAFLLLSDQIGDVAEIKQYLLTEWKPTTYERWWSTGTEGGHEGEVIGQSVERT